MCAKDSLELHELGRKERKTRGLAQRRLHYECRCLLRCGLVTLCLGRIASPEVTRWCETWNFLVPRAHVITAASTALVLSRITLGIMIAAVVEILHGASGLRLVERDATRGWRNC